MLVGLNTFVSSTAGYQVLPFGVDVPCITSADLWQWMFYCAYEVGEVQTLNMHNRGRSHTVAVLRKSESAAKMARILLQVQVVTFGARMQGNFTYAYSSSKAEKQKPATVTSLPKPAGWSPKRRRKLRPDLVQAVF